MQLKPHQITGVEFIHGNNGRCLVCDDPGLGKTLQTLTYVKESKNFPMVVVCPATVKGTWKAEAKKWLGDIPVHIMQGKSPEPVPPETKILVTSYNLLYPRIKCLTAFIGKTIVFDEEESSFVEDSDLDVFPEPKKNKRELLK
jgi:SWI/SNF-related matrix-associated actin-dependent regulator 1 of chromatin subfamily A